MGNKGGEPARLPTTEAGIIRQVRADLKAIRSEPWFREGRWGVSRHNFRDEFRLPEAGRQVRIVDITGRSIEQVPGIALTVDEKLDLARALSDAGITEMHAAIRIGAPEMQAHVKAITSSDLRMRVVALTLRPADVTAAASAGAHIAEVITQGRPSLHAATHGIQIADEDELIADAVERIRLARAAGLEVRADVNVVAFVDVSHVKRFARAATDAGASSIHLADGTAGLGPHAVRFLVETVRESAPEVAVGLHLHNDMGLALANALAGFEAGATIFDVSVNGIGERAGQVDLAQLAVTLEALYQVDTGIRMPSLRGLSEYVQDLSRTRLPGTYPIVGDFAFGDPVEHLQRQEHDIDHDIHRPISPTWVGQDNYFPLGRHTGRFGLLLRAEQRGIEVAEADVPMLLETLDHWFQRRKRPISDSEFDRLLRSAHTGSRVS